MKLIVGLGNPGPKYQFTRHNAGFLLLDVLADKFGFSPQGKKFEGEFSKGELLGSSVLLVKPETYMNLSGQCVSKFARFFKIQPSDIIAIYDDVDLAPTKVKGRFGGGDGGHNGVKSLVAELGTRDFHRVKIGVGRPEVVSGDITDWVLGDLTPEELEKFRNTILDDVLVRIKGIFQTSDARDSTQRS